MTNNPLGHGVLAMTKARRDDMPFEAQPPQPPENRHPHDRLLRDHGFRIYSRPDHGPALWSRSGNLYTHNHALSLVLGS